LKMEMKAIAHRTTGQNKAVVDSNVARRKGIWA
jgi:hypothetical protein